MKLWIAEDADNPIESGLALTKSAAQAMVASNRGFKTYKDCEENGYAQPIYSIRIAPNVAKIIAAQCKKFHRD